MESTNPENNNNRKELACDKPRPSDNNPRWCECGTKMSSLSHDTHTRCANCIGFACNLDTRCNHCQSWNEEDMKRYLKHQAKLSSKRKSKRRSKERKCSKFSNTTESSIGELFSSNDSTDDSDVLSIAGSSGSQINNTFFEQVADIEKHVAQESDSNLEDNLIEKLDNRFQKKLDSMLTGIANLIDNKIESKLSSTNTSPPTQASNEIVHRERHPSNPTPCAPVRPQSSREGLLADDTTPLSPGVAREIKTVLNTLKVLGVIQSDIDKVDSSDIPAKDQNKAPKNIHEAASLAMIKSPDGGRLASFAKRSSHAAELETSAHSAAKKFKAQATQEKINNLSLDSQGRSREMPPINKYYLATEEKISKLSHASQASLREKHPLSKLYMAAQEAKKRKPLVPNMREETNGKRQGINEKRPGFNEKRPGFNEKRKGTSGRGQETSRREHETGGLREVIDEELPAYPPQSPNPLPHRLPPSSSNNDIGNNGEDGIDYEVENDGYDYDEDDDDYGYYDCEYPEESVSEEDYLNDDDSPPPVIDEPHKQTNIDDSSQTKPEDKVFKRLLQLVTRLFPQAKPENSKPPSNLCLHEINYSEVKEKDSFSQLRLYDRVSVIRSKISEKVSTVMGSGGKPSSLLPQRKRSFRVAEDKSFDKPPELNPEIQGISTKTARQLRE